MITEIPKLSAPGFITDQPDMSLPNGAWTDSRNVEYRDGAAEKCPGYTQALGNLSLTAIWASPMTDGANLFWAYASPTVMYATDGTTHTNITGSITLGASDDLNYSGGPFHGYLLVNDGQAIPQSWAPGLGNDLVSLTAWPAVTLTCKVMRTFKDFIFAFRITDNGSYNPREIRWSDRAPPGGLPLSWDFADPTNQAGKNELGQTQDAIVDGAPLRDSLVIYKENHTWLADYIGTDDIFSFRQVFTQIGLLSERCAISFGGQHLVWTDQDIVIHNGNDAKSILDSRVRRWLFSRINTNRYRRSFAVADYRRRTAYFCFPESGRDWPTMALAWNWVEDTFHPYDLGGAKTWAENGLVPGDFITIDELVGTMDGLGGTIDDLGGASPFSGYVMFTDATAPRAYQGNTGETYNGTPMTCYAERTGITKDLRGIRRIRRIYPKVIGAAGDTLRFYVGVRRVENAAVMWNGPYPFTIGTDYKIDLGRGRGISGRILDFRVEYGGSSTFRLYGIDIEHDPDGLR